MNYSFAQHTHEDPQGSLIVHRHDVGQTTHLGDTYDLYDPASHYHLIILGERNFVNWYTAPARNWKEEAK